MDTGVARDRIDAAADRGGHDIDLAPLQPLGAAHIVGIAPGARLPIRCQVPRQRTTDEHFLAEFVEQQGSSERLIVGKRGNDVGLVPLGGAREVQTQLARPARADGRVVDVSGRVQPAAQFTDLLFQDGDGDAGGTLDGRQHLALGQRFQPGLHELPEQAAERPEIGRVGQSLGSGFELRDGRERRRCRKLNRFRPLVVGRGRATA